MQAMSESPIEWKKSDGLVPYEAALSFMLERVQAIRQGHAPECIWLLEHPPLYTAGTSAKLEDLREPNRFPVFEAGRGGEYTYHGPGQRVAYVMLDVAARGKDVRKFVSQLETWIIETLGLLGVKGETRKGRVGVWVTRSTPADPEREDKIAAIGVRLKRWVSFHGISLNVSPDLSHFGGITPCGISDPRFGVTSLEALGAESDMERVDAAFKRAFETVFSSEEAI